jgi:hypothetical protein
LGGGSCDPYFFLNISLSKVKLRLYTENQLPRLSLSVLKVPGGGGWVDPLSSLAPTHVEVELGCDKKIPLPHLPPTGKGNLN